MNGEVLMWYLLLLGSQGALSQGVSGSQTSKSSSAGVPDLHKRCMLRCPMGYVPGTCLCQSGTVFPFIFNNTPCRFARCQQGEACSMKDGKAVCLAIAKPVLSADVCSLPQEPGPCRASIRRFYFDKTDGTCKIFIYGGCGANKNNFVTKQQCESRCIVDVPAEVGSSIVALGQGSDPQPVSSDRLQQRCRLPKKVGPCFAYIPSFFFNSTTGRCERFVFGGCRGNGNRFETLQACQEACPSDVQPAITPTPDSQPRTGRLVSTNSQCNLPKVTGPCRAYMPSYFYNTQTERCESFVYGGCRGNANRFRSHSQCLQTCKPGNVGSSPCQQSKEVGFCFASMPRWFFDRDSQACQPFTYGGCGGNENNFVSKAACERQCVSSPTSSLPAPKILEVAGNTGEVGLTASQSLPLSPATTERAAQSRCSLPKVTGRCRAAFRRFYFDSETGRCTRFIYGGCGGNQNNFQSRNECERACP